MPTSWKICRSWVEFKNFRKEKLTAFHIDRVQQRVQELIIEDAIAQYFNNVIKEMAEAFRAQE